MLSISPHGLFKVGEQPSITRETINRRFETTKILTIGGPYLRYTTITKPKPIYVSTKSFHIRIQLRLFPLTMFITWNSLPKPTSSKTIPWLALPLPYQEESGNLDARTYLMMPKTTANLPSTGNSQALSKHKLKSKFKFREETNSWPIQIHLRMWWNEDDECHPVDTLKPATDGTER